MFVLKIQTTTDKAGRKMYNFIFDDLDLCFAWYRKDLQDRSEFWVTTSSFLQPMIPVLCNIFENIS